MKGFVVRNQQLLAIVASAAVLIIVAGALTGIILAGRKSSNTAAKPTPGATFEPGPSGNPSGTPGPSGSASPGGSPPASGAASPSGAGGRATATPSSSGNGGTGCTGVAVCTPGPGGPPAAFTAPAVPKVSFTDFPLPLAGGGPVAASASPKDTGSVWFTEGTSSRIGVVSAGSSVREFSVPAGATPLGMAFNGYGDLWIIEAGANSIVEYSAVSLYNAATGNGLALTPSHVFHLGPTGQFRSSVTAKQGVEGIAVDANGDVWFSEYSLNTAGGNVPAIGHIRANQVGTDSFVPEVCALTPHLASAGHPMGLVATTVNGKVQLYVATDLGLGVFTPPSSCVSDTSTRNGTYTQAPPSAGSPLIQSLAVDHSGMVWFGTQDGVGRVVNGSAPLVTALNSNTATGLSGSHLGLVEAPDPSQGQGSTSMWTSFQGGAANPGIARVLNGGAAAFPSSAQGGDDLRAVASDTVTETGGVVGHIWIADASANKIIEASIKD